MSEADVVRDIRDVLKKVSDGTAVIVEQGDRTLAVIMPVSMIGNGPGRPIDECIALAEARNSGATLDDEFAVDLQTVIARNRPLNTSLWD